MKTEKELYELLSNDPSKVQSLCRICLCENAPNAVSLFNEEESKRGSKEILSSVEDEVSVWEKVMICGRVKVGNDDKLPKLICGSCYYDLDIAHLFRIKCQQADTLLRKVLEDTLIKNEEKNILQSDSTLEINSENCEDIKHISEVLDVEDIKKETLEYTSDTHYDDFDDDYVPTVKKKKKEKKLKSKSLKIEILEEDNSVLKIEKEANEDNAEHSVDTHTDDDKKDRKCVCHLCRKTLASKYSLAKHMVRMHGEAKKKKMGNVSGYGAERRYHCTECDYKCKRRQALNYHMTVHTGLKPFKCDQCPRSFSQHGTLYAHRKTHSDIMYYTCQECGRQFKQRDVFKNHRRVHSNEYKYICKICNKGLKTQKTLNEHMNRHLQIKNYSCEFCGMSFVTRVELANHLRVHNKNETFKCSFCEYTSHSKGTLAVHIKRHTGERSFKCEHCDYSFYTPGELRFHKRRHTKEQNYSCPLCDMKFRYSTSVNKHMLKKHGEKYRWNDVVDRRVVK